MNQSTAGWRNGMLGVLIFSGSLPATRLAVADFSPLFLTGARGVIAALLGASFLLIRRESRPARSDLGALSITALGVVIGFPLLTALALQRIDAAHSIVFIGLLPLSTAIFGMLRGGERPGIAFWVFSCIGAAAVVSFAFSRGGSGDGAGDLFMGAAIVLCGLDYAEGATLTRRMGGWQVICWALVLALPVMAVIALLSLPGTLDGIKASAWLGLAYVSIFSMLVGFIFWYRGLALGGIARVGQLQLLQPFFGLILAAFVVGEPVVRSMFASTLVVVLSVFGARRFA